MAQYLVADPNDGNVVDLVWNGFPRDSLKEAKACLKNLASLKDGKKYKIFEVRDKTLEEIGNKTRGVS